MKPSNTPITDRLCDTSPCESEYPTEDETYEPDPIAKGIVHSSGIVVICIVVGFVMAIIKALF